MKVLILLASLSLALAAPQVKPRAPPIEPRDSSCASMPSFLTTDRIVGGADASAVIPWQVSVRSSGSHFCGGTVLDSQTVLCAAHCFTSGQSMDGITIKVGDIDRTTGGQTVNVANGIWNTDAVYDSDTYDNDIVILKLSTALTLGDDVQAACLPDADYSPSEGQVCIVSGWGTMEYGGTELPDTLKWVGVPVVTNDDCNSVYGGINDGKLCAGYTEGGKDSCQGDSGGPFVCDNDGNSVIAGVVSYGYGCATAGYPGVYARVTNYLEWIQANMGANGITVTDDGGDDDDSTSEGCLVDSWKGDGQCDDENNTAGCDYDGGDCCGDSVDTTYCSVCACLEA